jgi:hypothetical protein
MHGHHLSLTPSEQRSQIHALIRQHLRHDRSESFLWWIQLMMLQQCQHYPKLGNLVLLGCKLVLLGK